MKKFNQLVNEIKMSDAEEARSTAYSGKRATNLLKHSWAQHDVSKEKAKVGDKEGAAKAASVGSRAHKLYLKAQKQHHARTPEQHTARANQMMSGASQDYKDQEKKRGIGHVRDSVEHSGNAINEISKQLRDRYVQRAVTAHGGYNMARRNTTGDDKKHWERKEKNTQAGISRALSDKRLAKEESDACHVCGQTPCNCTHITEVSKKVLSSYISKAIDDKELHATASSFVAGRHGTNPYNDSDTSEREQKRATGIKKALARLTKEDNELQDQENVNELKVSTLLRYTTKANRSATKLGGDAARARDSGDMEAWAKKANKADTREKGIRVATFKMHKQLNKGK